MQIDRFNYLQFPRDTSANAPGNDSTAGANGAGVGQTQAKSPLPPAAPPVERSSTRADSVVLKIQWPDSPSPAGTPGADSPVYSNARKSAVPASAEPGSDPAQDHQRAVARNAGVFTQLAVSKDGVLVAKPQAASETKPPDFVALAVSAMREFSDEAQRQKLRAFDASAAMPVPTPEAHRNSIKGGLQQLAARFNVFA